MAGKNPRCNLIITKLNGTTQFDEQLINYGFYKHIPAYPLTNLRKIMIKSDKLKL